MAGIIFYGIQEYYRQDTKDPVITISYKKRGKDNELKIITFEYEKPLNPEYPKFRAMESLRAGVYEYMKTLLEGEEGNPDV